MTQKRHWHDKLLLLRVAKAEQKHKKLHIAVTLLWQTCLTQLLGKCSDEFAGKQLDGHNTLMCSSGLPVDARLSPAADAALQRLLVS